MAQSVASNLLNHGKLDKILSNDNSHKNLVDGRAYNEMKIILIMLQELHQERHQTPQ
jgi:hypothetical protein